MKQEVEIGPHKKKSRRKNRNRINKISLPLHQNKLIVVNFLVVGLHRIQ